MGKKDDNMMSKNLGSLAGAGISSDVIKGLRNKIKENDNGQQKQTQKLDGDTEQEDETVITVDTTEIITTKQEDKKTNTVEDSITNELAVTNENTLLSVIMKKPIIDNKRPINFYLHESTIKLVKKYSGTGRGKTGLKQSELVDYLLKEVLMRLEIK